MNWGPDYLSYDGISQKAEEFLKNYHPSRSLPIPIEEIVDIKLGIHVVPRLGLHGEINQDGFISSDLTTITVDEYVYDYVDVRYRFTLAHEIGHAVLHEAIYKSFECHSPQQWKEFEKNIPPKERKWFEWQANCFAGLVLVPREELSFHMSDCIKKIDEMGISLRDNWDFAWDEIAKNLGKNVFNVSSDTIRIRLDYDEIKERYK